MPRRHPSVYYRKTLKEWTAGKSEYTVALLNQFLREYKKIGRISVEPSKSLITIATKRKGIAYVSKLGRNFIHVVFTFKEAYTDNLCFIKIVPAYGQKQFNHHCRIFSREDINAEVRKYMKQAFELGQ